MPVVNVAAPLLWFGFGAWMLALHFVDYASENRGLKLDDTIALLRANRGPAFGFGAVVALLMAVPFRRPGRHTRGSVRRRPAVEASLLKRGSRGAVQPTTGANLVLAPARPVASATSAANTPKMAARVNTMRGSE